MKGQFNNNASSVNAALQTVVTDAITGLDLINAYRPTAASLAQNLTNITGLDLIGA
jgi:hypothetical protein